MTQYSNYDFNKFCMTKNHLEVIIIGGGPAGLSASYFLKQYGLQHIVFEKGKIGESWRSQRWNSFRLNSPNRLNELPGGTYFESSSEKFSSALEYVSSLEEYCRTNDLPVWESTVVRSVEKLPGSELFRIEVSMNDGYHVYHAKNIIVASGFQSEFRPPALAKNISSAIYQLHAGKYRNANALPEGNVLVVGSAQSGCQIADDLAFTGRKIFLSTSMVGRVPRSYRGKDIHDWLLEMGFFDMRKDQINDEAMLNMKAPQLTGVGEMSKTISLQSLSKKGVCIIGKLKDATEDVLIFENNAAAHIKFADGFSMQVKKMIDDFIAKKQINTPGQAHDEEDLPDENASCAIALNSLDLQKENITSIIWATGFTSNLGYLKLPVLDVKKEPLHKEGVGEMHGIYFLGFHWLRNRKSSLLCGICEDAAFVAGKIYSSVAGKTNKEDKLIL